MDTMIILGLVWRINLPTPCLSEAVMTNMTRLVASLLNNASKVFNKAQMELFILAMLTSSEWHKGARRKDKEETPYIIHPLEIVELLFALGIYDFKLIIATILHDTVEDEGDKVKRFRKRAFITKRFNTNVREVVELVTKSKRSKERARFFVRLTSEKRAAVATRAQLLKLADCAKNTETFDVFDEKKIKQKIAEVRREYPVVLAKALQNIKRLNISQHKREHLSTAAKELFQRIETNLKRY